MNSPSPVSDGEDFLTRGEVWILDFRYLDWGFLSLNTYVLSISSKRYCIFYQKLDTSATSAKLA